MKICNCFKNVVAENKSWKFRLKNIDETRNYFFIKYWKISDKVLCDKTFNIAKNPNYDEDQCGLSLMIENVFDKKNFWWYC